MEITESTTNTNNAENTSANTTNTTVATPTTTTDNNTNASNEPMMLVTSRSANPSNHTEVLQDIRITVEAKNDDNTEKLAYYANEDIQPFAGFTVSDTSQDMRNTKLRLTIPKENINIGTIGSFQNIDPVRSDNDANYIATWNFDNVTGGQFADVPFVFQFQKNTPKNTSIQVKADFLNENDEVIGSTTKTFTIKINDTTFIPYKVITELSGANN